MQYPIIQIPSITKCYTRYSRIVRIRTQTQRNGPTHKTINTHTIIITSLVNSNTDNAEHSLRTKILNPAHTRTITCKLRIRNNYRHKYRNRNNRIARTSITHHHHHHHLHPHTLSPIPIPINMAINMAIKIIKVDLPTSHRISTNTTNSSNRKLPITQGCAHSRQHAPHSSAPTAGSRPISTIMLLRMAPRLNQ